VRSASVSDLALVALLVLVVVAVLSPANSPFSVNQIAESAFRVGESLIAHLSEMATWLIRSFGLA